MRQINELIRNLLINKLEMRKFEKSFVRCIYLPTNYLFDLIRINFKSRKRGFKSRKWGFKSRKRGLSHGFRKSEK